MDFNIQKLFLSGVVESSIFDIDDNHIFMHIQAPVYNVFDVLNV